MRILNLRKDPTYYRSRKGFLPEQSRQFLPVCDKIAKFPEKFC